MREGKKMSNEEMKKIERLDDLTEIFWDVKKALRQSEKFVEEVHEEEFIFGGEVLELVEQILCDLYKYNANVVKKLTYTLVKEYKGLDEGGY